MDKGLVWKINEILEISDFDPNNSWNLYGCLKGTKAKSKFFGTMVEGEIYLDFYILKHFSDYRVGCIPSFFYLAELQAFL
jgi:hypothetical protein